MKAVESMGSQTICQNDVARKVLDSVKVRVRRSPSSSSSSFQPVPSSAPKLCENLSDCCSTRFMILNHSNFKRSGAPVRSMFYQDGSWIDFPREVLESLRLAFTEGKPMVDVSIGGAKYIFDFLRMLQIDFGTGNQRSIAWIDEAGKCFFPKVFVGDELTNARGMEENSGNPKIEIEIRIDGNSCKRKVEQLEFRSNDDKEEEVSSSNKRDGNAAKRLRLESTSSETSIWPCAKVLSPGDQAYSVVSNLFMAGIRKIDPSATITAIHQCTRTGPLERARFDVFQKQNEIIKASRGASNAVHAWYGASAKAVAGVLAHGFSVSSKVSGSETYGSGIYLSPVGFPHLSALQSDADDNGEKHVILCRVILGNLEMVEAGSQQCHPSSVDFDTGADDPKNPRRYVVWCTNMNSHILPECVVSYKSPKNVLGQFRGSTKYPFAKLISQMKSSLPASKVQEAMTLYDNFRAGKMAKDVFIKQLRSTVGDEMLLLTIREIRASE